MQPPRSKHLRTVKSFVRRQGRLTQGQERALEKLFPLYGIETKDQLFDLTDIFGRNNPKILEIGFGNGDSLATQASKSPNNDYLGIEVHRPGVGHLLSQIEQNQLSNVRVICNDAVEVLKKCIPDNSLDGVQIFFPDPWHKKRHHKRRLIQIDFIELLSKKLKPGGTLHMATDWENYAEHMLDVMLKIDIFTNTASEGQFVTRPTHRPLTKFEQRGQRLGHGVWDLIFKLN